jgi:hypothetical protein
MFDKHIHPFALTTCRTFTLDRREEFVPSVSGQNQYEATDAADQVN